MTTQPEALRLADALASWEYTSTGLCGQAAAELRRLHAELERCKQVCAATSECWRKDAEKWKDQRDALLEALKNIERSTYDAGTAALARVATAKMEGQQ